MGTQLICNSPSLPISRLSFLHTQPIKDRLFLTDQTAFKMYNNPRLLLACLKSTAAFSDRFLSATLSLRLRESTYQSESPRFSYILGGLLLNIVSILLVKDSPFCLAGFCRFGATLKASAFGSGPFKPPNIGFLWVYRTLPARTYTHLLMLISLTLRRHDTL